MAYAPKRAGPATKIWQNGPSGQVLVKDIEGLPYGQDHHIQIPDLGEATLIGIQKSGTGNQEAIAEVSYLLKQCPFDNRRARS